VAATSAVRVVGLVDDDREGTYRLSGELRGVPVAVGLEMYVARAGADSSDLSSFVAGTWVDGAIDESADGGVIGTSLTLTIVQQVPTQPDSLAAYIVTGPLGAAATTVQVYDEQLELIGALELRRLGPP